MTVMTTTPIQEPTELSPIPDEPAWAAAGAAWEHAAVDWAYLFEPYARDAIDLVFDELQIRHGVDLLDVACGSGYALGRAERLGARTAGIDASAGLVDIARRRAPASELVAGDMFALPWDEESFDRVTAFNGIWGGCDAAIAEARRVLRPGGRIGLTFWGPGDALELRDWFITLGMSTPAIGEEMISLANIGEPGVAEQMLSDNGFTDVRRSAAPSIHEFADGDTAWRALRSPGIVKPALDAVGESELRHRLMASVDHLRASDGSYRVVNELTCVTATVADG
jgi:SAM-dependent methyltransferase